MNGMNYDYVPVYADLSIRTPNHNSTAPIYDSVPPRRAPFNQINSRKRPIAVGETPEWLQKENRNSKVKRHPQLQLLVNIGVSVRHDFGLGETRQIKKSPQFNNAMAELFERFNRVSTVDQLDSKNKGTWEIMETLLQRQIIDARKINKKKIRINAELENIEYDVFDNSNFVASDSAFERNEVANELQFTDGDIVIYAENQKMKYIAKVSNPVPMDTNGVFNNEKVEVKPLLSLCQDELEYVPVLHLKTNLMQLNLTLNQIHCRLGGYLDGLNQLNSLEEELNEDNENGLPICVKTHKPGDLLAIDLGSKYAEDWPLIGEIKSVKAGGQFEIIWLWTEGKNMEDGLSMLQQKFEHWKVRGGHHKEKISARAHFACCFTLEDQRLPEFIQDAIAARMNN